MEALGLDSLVKDMDWSRYVGWTWFFDSMFVPQVRAVIHLRVSRDLVIDLIQASGRSSTKKQYSSAWQLGLEYCDKHGISGFFFSVILCWIVSLVYMTVYINTGQ